MLPAGELAHAAPLEPGEIHQLERANDPLPQLVTPCPRRLEAEGDVFADVEMRKERVVLEHHPEAPGHRLDVGDVFAVHQDPPRVGRLESREQAQRGGLPASARAEQCQHLAARERERDAVHREDAVEALDETLEPEEVGHWDAARPVPRTCLSQ